MRRPKLRASFSLAANLTPSPQWPRPHALQADRARRPCAPGRRGARPPAPLRQGLALPQRRAPHAPPLPGGRHPRRCSCSALPLHGRAQRLAEAARARCQRLLCRRPLQHCSCCRPSALAPQRPAQPRPAALRPRPAAAHPRQRRQAPRGHPASLQTSHARHAERVPEAQRAAGGSLAVPAQPMRPMPQTAGCRPWRPAGGRRCWRRRPRMRGRLASSPTRRQARAGMRWAGAPGARALPLSLPVAGALERRRRALQQTPQK